MVDREYCRREAVCFERERGGWRRETESGRKKGRQNGKERLGIREPVEASVHDFHRWTRSFQFDRRFLKPLRSSLRPAWLNIAGKTTSTMLPFRIPQTCRIPHNLIPARCLATVAHSAVYSQLGSSLINLSAPLIFGTKMCRHRIPRSPAARVRSPRRTSTLDLFLVTQSNSTKMSIDLKTASKLFINGKVIEKISCSLHSCTKQPLRPRIMLTSLRSMLMPSLARRSSSTTPSRANTTPMLPRLGLTMSTPPSRLPKLLSPPGPRRLSRSAPSASETWPR